MSIKEASVGIIAFASQLPGFQAVLKHRIDDFHVNEINLKGEVAKLTNFELPKSEIGESIKRNFKDTEAVLEGFAELVGRDECEKLIPFIKKGGIGQEYKAVKLKPIQDKDKRKLVHDFFKNRLPGFVEMCSKTGENEKNEKIIEIFPKEQMKEQGCRRSKNYRGGKKKFLNFILHKKNIDNNEALNMIANNLRISISKLKIAGTKDKRGVTSQSVTGFCIDAQDLLNINTKIRNIKVGNLWYGKRQIFMGDLFGNQFCVALRNIQYKDKVKAVEACEMLSKKGFINYFGLQRFGVRDPTHIKGAALLRGDWANAAYLILKDEIDDEDVNVSDIESLIKMRIKEKNEGKNRVSANERKLLMAYEKNGYGEHLMAIQSLPMKLKTMYVHAYQSYLWNMAVTKRIEDYGLDKLLVGDLVLDSTCGSSNNLFEIESEKRRGNVHVVTEADITDEKYTIYDLVLPLASGSIRFPNNDTSNIFISLIEGDELSLDKCNHDCATFDLTKLSGDYRKVIVLPKDFSYEIVKVENNDESLFVSDYEKLKIEGLVPDDYIDSNPKNEDLVLDNYVDRNLKDEEHTSKKMRMDDESGILALKLTFKLPASSYATMLVRELTKMSTHSKDQVYVQSD